MKPALKPWEALQGRLHVKLLPQVLCLLLFPAIVAAAPPKVAWRTHTGDRAEHGAALLGGRFFAAGTHKLTELDPATGDIRRFLLPPDSTPLTSPPVATDAGVVSGDRAGRLVLWVAEAPAVVLGALRRARPVTALHPGDPDGLVTGDEAGCVHVLDGLGAKVWSHCTGGAIGRSLTVAAGLILAGDPTGRVTTWSGDRGALRWIYDTDGPLAGAPAVFGEAVVLVGTDGHLYALDRARGVLRWRVHVGDRLQAPPAWFGGLVILATETRGLVAIDGTTGKVAWRASLPSSKASPAVLGDLVVVGASDNRLHGFDAKTGRARWRVRVGGVVLAPPLLHEAGILAITEDGVAFCLR